MFFSQLLPEHYCTVSWGTTSKSSSDSISMDFCLELKGICEPGVFTRLKTSLTVRFISPFGILSRLCTEQNLLSASPLGKCDYILRAHIHYCTPYGDVLPLCHHAAQHRFFSPLVVSFWQMSLQLRNAARVTLIQFLAKFYQSLAEWHAVIQSTATECCTCTLQWQTQATHSRLSHPALSIWITLAFCV